MTVGDQEALTVADLCSSNSNHTDETDDHSTIEFADDEDDDSFLANSSLCKQHKSTIRMLDSLRKEVVEMTRDDGDNGTRITATPKKAPRDMTIDMNSTSPLISPMHSRNLLSMAKGTKIPVFNNNIMKLEKNEDKNHRHRSNSDDSTLCSMDNSINQEMNVLKEVAMELEKELKAENLNTVFQAIERIDRSEDPTIKGVLGSEDKEIIREIIRNELNRKEQTQQNNFLERCRLDIIMFIQSVEGGSMNIKILIVSIVLGLIRKFIFAWADQDQRQ